MSKEDEAALDMAVEKLFGTNDPGDADEYYEFKSGWNAADEHYHKRIAELEAVIADGLEFARQTYTRARLMDQKTPMMLKLLSRIERLLETLESEGGADTNPR